MEFYKYQGTGNDFILIDARNAQPQGLDVQKLCDRRFGIGGDGLMLLQSHPEYDFEMIYYNSDGKLSSMCGNGGRCIAKFATSLGLGHGENLRFIAIDGPHDAIVKDDYVELGMRDVVQWEKRSDSVFVLNTGSPHYVKFIDTDPSNEDIVSIGKEIRYNDEFRSDGINVNIVQQIASNEIKIRTYERGVEDETLSCGTGVTAAALALQLKNNNPIASVNVQTMGGGLTVKSTWTENRFSKVVLCGLAIFVFKGNI